MFQSTGDENPRLQAAAPAAHRHLLASLAMLAVAAVVAVQPGSAESKSLAGGQAKSASEGGVDPGTTPPPVPGVPPMDSRTGWVFPIREAHRMVGPSSWREDQGVDLGYGLGFSRSFCGARANLVAVDDAVVTKIGLNGFGGQSPVLRLTHGPYSGRQVYYGHSQPTVVRVGQVVKRGQVISHIGCGIVGRSSAPHLEFGLFRRGQPYCCPSWGETSGEVLGLLRRMWTTAVATSRRKYR